MREGPKFKIEKKIPFDADLKQDIKGLNSESSLLSRRGFLKKAIVASGVTAAATVGCKIFSENKGDELSDSKTVGPKVIESIESIESVEGVIDRFNPIELVGYKAFVQLKKDEVLFLDANNQPVGGPQKFVDYVDSKIGGDGQVEMEKYLFSPGKMNEVGIIANDNGVPGEWFDYVQAKVQTEYPERKITRKMHVLPDLLGAYQEKDEPELIEGIKNGEIDSYWDVVHYFADKPVWGIAEYSRREYVEAVVKFSDNVPLVVQEELRWLMPGLCAQESKFNAGLKSINGARGIFQFKKSTWGKGYAGKEDEYISLQRQVEIAGQFISDLYQQITDLLGKDVLFVLQQQYVDESEFQRKLLVPLMLNSYNAGSSRVAEATRLFIETVDLEEVPAGDDLFIAIADFAKQSSVGKYLKEYKNDSREYVPRIYAQAEIFHSE